jgi:hypothetical protein
LRYFQSDALNFMRVLPGDYTGEALRQTLMSLNNALFLQALGEGKEAREDRAGQPGNPAAFGRWNCRSRCRLEFGRSVTACGDHQPPQSLSGG